MSRADERVAVSEFSALMQGRLDDKAEKYGRAGWKDTPSQGLLAHLREEMRELFVAYNTESSQAVASEAADVANLAMMVADSVGGLE